MAMSIKTVIKGLEELIEQGKADGCDENTPLNFGMETVENQIRVSDVGIISKTHKVTGKTSKEFFLIFQEKGNGELTSIEDVQDLIRQVLGEEEGEKLIAEVDASIGKATKETVEKLGQSLTESTEVGGNA